MDKNQIAKYIDALLIELSEASFPTSIPMALEMKKLPDGKDEKKYKELERTVERLGLVEIINQGNSTLGGYKEYFISQKGSDLLDSNASSIILLKSNSHPMEILFDKEYWDDFHNDLIEKRINEADFYFDLLVSVGYSNFNKDTIRKYFREWYIQNSQFDLQIEDGDIALEDGDFKMLPSLDKKQIANFLRSFESKKNDFFDYLKEEGINLKDIKPNDMKELFIMYAWDSEEHKNEVIAFTNKLRKSGFDAEMDRLVSQNETATDFRKMMHKAVTDYNKVIIVLSKGYREKADKFDGGVGIEYSMIIKDIERSKNKYILVTFDEINDSIFPVEFREREVLNLSIKKDWNTLFAKLQDEDIISFSEVGKEKPKIVKHYIGEMKTSTEALKIVSFDLEQGDCSTFGGLLEKIDYELSITLKNLSSKPIKDFNIEMHYPVGTVSTPNQTSIRENHLVVTYEIKDKIFSSQEKQIKFDNIKLRKDNASKIFNSDIIVKIYFDEGYLEEKFLLSDYFLYNPSGYNQRKLSLNDFQNIS